MSYRSLVNPTNNDLSKTCLGKVNSRRGVKGSRGSKEGSRLAPAREARGIGGCFIPGEGRVEPFRGSLESFGKESVALLGGRSRGEEISFDRADSFVGLFGGLQDSSLKERCAHVPHAEVEAPTSIPAGAEGCVDRKRGRGARVGYSSACHYVPLTVDARYAYPLISDSVAGDASSTFGWGVCVGPYIAYGRWSDATLKTLRRLSSEEEEVLSDSVRRRSCAQAEHLPSRTVLSRILFCESFIVWHMTSCEARVDSSRGAIILPLASQLIIEERRVYRCTPGCCSFQNLNGLQV